MKKLDVRLFRMIKHSKGQFISIVAIVAAALCVYVLFSLTTLNVNAAADDYYSVTNINDIQVQLVKLPQSVLHELYAIEGVKEVQGRLSFDVPLKVLDENEKVMVRILSIPESGEKINRLYRFGSTSGMPGEQEAVVLQQFASARGIEPGDTLMPTINGIDRPLKVIDIAASSEFIYLMENEQALLPNPERFGILYVSEKFAQNVYGFGGFYNEVLVTIEDQGKIDDIINALEKKLDPYGVKKVTKLKDLLSHNVLTQKMDGIEKMSAVMPAMFLFVGAIIIVIMLSRIVNNDRIPIGVIKGLGYRNVDVLSHYTKYVLAIGFLGSFIGIIGGYLLAGPLSEVFVYYFNIPFVTVKIYPSFILSAIVMTSVFCVASGLLGARGVLSISPADAMRPEAPKSGKRILLERVRFVWQRISFSWKMVIRNVMRTKRRFAFLVLGLAMAYGINTVPLYMANAMPVMFKIQYETYQKMDYVVDFNRPLNASAIQSLYHAIDASRIEGRLEFPFELSNGWYKKGTVVVGVEKDSQFYQFFDTKDRQVEPSPDSIMVTEGLARALHVKVGDPVKIKNFIPGKSDIWLPVSQIVRQYLGSNAFMDIETMQRLMLDKQMISGVALSSEADVKSALEDYQNIASVRSTSDVKDSFAEYLNTVIVAVNAYMLFGGILGFSIIYNATVIGISERKMEFSSLRVMGFDKSDVFKIVTRENALLAVCAILVGIPLGIGMIQAMSVAFSSDMITFPILLPPKIFVTAAIAMGFFVVIAQLASRKKIVQLDFIEALKSRIS